MNREMNGNPTIRQNTAAALLGFLTLGGGIGIVTAADGQAVPVARNPASMASMKTLPAEAAALDRDLILARRQRDLLSTLAEISGLLEQVRAYRQPVMSLLDGNLVPGDRWRAAMASMPTPAASDGAQGQHEEILQLRAEVESLRAEMALFLQTAPQMVIPPPVEDGTGDALETQWIPDRSAIRFVQFAGVGETGAGETERPAVWLGAGDESARLEEGGTIRFAGRLIRLAALRPLADGRISIGLEVDGTPRTILW